jgi:predicted CoA-binding protein
MAEACELPRREAAQAEMRELLLNTRTIAVVGLSDNPNRPSYQVAEFLQSQGYRIIPVNPALTAVLGEKAYPDLKAVPMPIDMVDIFRKSEAVPAIVADAIAIGAKSVWMQEGVVHHEAAEQARAAGLAVVMDKCVLKEHLSAGLGPN